MLSQACLIPLKRPLITLAALPFGRTSVRLLARVNSSHPRSRTNRRFCAANERQLSRDSTRHKEVRTKFRFGPGCVNAVDNRRDQSAAGPVVALSWHSVPSMQFRETEHDATDPSAAFSHSLGPEGLKSTFKYENRRSKRLNRVEIMLAG